VWEVPRRVAGGFDPVELRHVQIHDDEVWAGGEHYVDRLESVLGFSDHFEAGHRSQQAVHALAYDRVVVSDDDRCRFLRHGVSHRIPNGM
jgi:hypothetical protein